MIDWLVDNKHWVFSGFGVWVFNLIGGVLLWKVRLTRPPQGKRPGGKIRITLLIFFAVWLVVLPAYLIASAWLMPDPASRARFLYYGFAYLAAFPFLVSLMCLVFYRRLMKLDKKIALMAKHAAAGDAKKLFDVIREADKERWHEEPQ